MLQSTLSPCVAVESAANPCCVPKKPGERGTSVGTRSRYPVQVLHGYLESAKETIEEEIHTGGKSDQAVMPVVQQAVQHKPEALQQQLLDLRGKVQELGQHNTQVSVLRMGLGEFCWSAADQATAATGPQALGLHQHCSHLMFKIKDAMQ